jgi:hypothetical protein
MEAGHYADACPELKKSHDLDPLPGVTFTLAEGEAQRGKTGSALRYYQEYLRKYDELDEAKKQRNAPRKAIASEQVAKLTDEVAQLRLVRPDDMGPGDEVVLDGEPLPAGETTVPVDPGNHQVVVRRADGDEQSFDVWVEKGERKELDLGGEDDGGSGSGSGGSPDLTTWAWVTGGVGVANLVVGIITTAAMLGERSTAEEFCVDDVCSSDEGVDAGNAARTLAHVSTAAHVIGFSHIAASAAMFLFFSGDGGSSDSAAWSVDLQGCPDGSCGHAALRLRW